MFVTYALPVICGGIAFALVWTRGLATLELLERIKRGERARYWGPGE